MFQRVDRSVRIKRQSRLRSAAAGRGTAASREKEEKPHAVFLLFIFVAGPLISVYNAAEDEEGTLSIDW
jgi:hypothetical protein